MESSFFEYRDKTGVESNNDSDTEIIDDSLENDPLLSVKKKNRTVFVAESEESTDETEDEKLQQVGSKSAGGSSGAADSDGVSGSDNDAIKRVSTRRQSQTSSNKFAANSSDEEEYSPELVPRRKPPMRPNSINSNDSIIVRKVKKRFLILESDTDNSIIIEHDKQRKQKCLKDTPIKIDDKVQNRVLDKSMEDDESDRDSDDVSEEDSEGDDNEDKSNKVDDTDKNDEESDDVDDKTEDDDGPDEDQMVMSRATRMSIMGVIPKDNDSDESDFIQSDDSSRKTRSIESLSSLPDIPNMRPESPEHQNSSRLTCSPFGSPLQNITQNLNESTKSSPKVLNDRAESPAVTFISETQNIQRTKLHSKGNKENLIHYDDDVTIIDTQPEIIALSSDDEDETKPEKSPKMRSPKPVKSTKLMVDEVTSNRSKDNTIQQYLVPPSYPNQVVYVKRHVRENELAKLNGLKEDLNNIRNLLDNMDVNSLPDGGVKLVERLTGLEAQVRRQGDKVANMVVEPEHPTAEDIAKDGFEKGLSWDEIQKASNAVQPRMFGKQAMATHMAERSLILDRLRDLHQSLDSRPAETEHAAQPPLVTTELMTHQLHALAWLRWRETQRPAAGILADDMGLGKTITMIALIASDKDKRIDNDDADDEEYTGKGGAKLSVGGTLVVCPASLMQQWANEVSKHCAPRALSVALHHGPARACAPPRLAHHDLVLTTYNILQRDNEKNGVLMRVSWRRVILDEAHIVRNHKSSTSLAVAALRARRRWCLTGTPVQNKDIDLYALLKFLKCTPFDDLTMWKKWIDNKSLGGQERLSTVMRCILLRRTKVQLQEKGQLACLPKRDTHQVQVTLTKPEMNVYQKVLVFSKTLFAQFLHQRAEKNSDAIGFTAPGKNSEYDKMHKKMIALQGAKPVKSHEILVLLLRLRQVCCHCGLIASMLDDAGDGEDPADSDLLAELNKLSLQDSSGRKSTSRKDQEEEEQEVPEEGTTAAEAIRSVLSPNNPVFNLQNMSSKIHAAMDCLQQNVIANKGEKAVVVSQWTSVLRLVELELQRRKVRSVTLSGAVPVPARPPLINALNDPKSDVKVMLLSLCAGGVGLNLCGANHLLLLDPHWNPQLEEQAQDRIYRVGQTKHVHIYRFMCVDTVEQSIRKLQQAKLELAENVLTGAKNTASKLSIEDLKMLFNMGQ